MFAVVGIVRSLTAPSEVGAMTEQGYQRIDVANNAAKAIELPPYPGGAEPKAGLYSVTQNQPEKLDSVTIIANGRQEALAGGATFDSPGYTVMGSDKPSLWQDAMPDSPTWLTTVRDPNGWFWVWANGWMSCQHVDTENLTYASIRTDPALAAWGQLSVRDQHDVAAICKG